MTLLKTGQHAAPRPERKGLRRLLPTGLTGWFVLAGSGIALAAYVIITSLTGSVTTGTFDILALGPSVTSGTCTATDTSTTSYDIQWVGAMPGDTCVIDLSFNAPGSNADDGVFEGFNVALPIGLDGTFGASCGAVLTPGTTSPITLTLALTGDASPGQTITIDGSSLSWNPAGVADASGCV